MCIEYEKWSANVLEMTEELSVRLLVLCSLQTLYSMDRRGCVIYINTFSHSLAPSMRMGYMVLPEALMARYRERLGFYSCSVPLFDQYVLARFISQGYFERHLNRLRRQNKGKPE